MSRTSTKIGSEVLLVLGTVWLVTALAIRAGEMATHSFRYEQQYRLAELLRSAVGPGLFRNALKALLASRDDLLIPTVLLSVRFVLGSVDLTTSRWRRVVLFVLILTSPLGTLGVLLALLTLFGCVLNGASVSGELVSEGLLLLAANGPLWVGMLLWFVGSRKHAINGQDVAFGRAETLGLARHEEEVRVRMNGRAGVIFTQGDRSLVIDGELLANGVQLIYALKKPFWKPPHESQQPTDEEWEAILKTVGERFHEKGWKIEIDRLH